MERRVTRVLVASVDGIEGDGVALYDSATEAFNIQDGELGIYNAETNTSLTVGVDTVSTAPRIYFAVGRDTDSDATVDTTTKSGVIEGRFIRNITVQCPTTEQVDIVDIRDFTAQCDTEYVVKVRFKSIKLAQDSYGYEDLRKTFSVTTSCCEEGCDCPEGDCDELADLLVANINEDPEGLITASKVSINDYDSGAITSAANVDSLLVDTVELSTNTTDFSFPYTTAQVANLQTDLNAWLQGDGTATATYAGGDWQITVTGTSKTFTDVDIGGSQAFTETAVTCPIVRLTAVNDADYCFTCGPPTVPYVADGLRLEVGLSGGFSCNGSAVKTQNLTYLQGHGCWLRHLEHEANGDQGVTESVYRVPFPTRPGPLYADETVSNYATLIIEYDDFHRGAATGHNIESPNTLIIAYPCDDTTTEANLEVFLDTYGDSLPFANFGSTGIACGC